MERRYDNKRTAMEQEINEAGDEEKRYPAELFDEFYEKQNNQKMSDEQRAFVEDCIGSIWEV